jgi:hypothetical protein
VQGATAIELAPTEVYNVGSEERRGVGPGGGPQPRAARQLAVFLIC